MQPARTAGTARPRSTSAARSDRSTSPGKPGPGPGVARPVARGRCPHDELDRHDALAPRAHRIRHELERALSRERPELLAVLPDRGERRVRERGGLEIVEADDSDIPAGCGA